MPSNGLERTARSLDCMRYVLAALTFAGLTAPGALARTPAPCCSIDIENKRKHDVAYEISAYPTESDARASEQDEMRRRRAFLDRLWLAPGQTRRFHFDGWVRWCILQPESALPCEIVPGDKRDTKVTLE